MEPSPGRKKHGNTAHVFIHHHLRATLKAPSEPRVVKTIIPRYTDHMGHYWYSDLLLQMNSSFVSGRRLLNDYRTLGRHQVIVTTIHRGTFVSQSQPKNHHALFLRSSR